MSNSSLRLRAARRPHSSCAPLHWFLVAALAATARGQSAAEPDGTAPKDNVTRLNPFVVSTSGDTGYQAQNSVSGSRLNTRLTDLAVPPGTDP